MTITQPAKLIAVYGSEWPFPASSDQTSSNILTASWRTYLQIASRVLNALSSHQGLFTAFLVIAYPFFAIVDFARELYLTFSFESIISGTGIALAASVLLGLIYLFPVSILIVGFNRWKRHRIPQMRMLLPVVLLWVVGIVLAVAGTLATIETIGVGGFAALAFATALLSALIPATRIVELKKPSPSKENTRQ
jgi:hypothetical protein